MVLEHLFPEDWLEKKTRYAFLLGVGYSAVGILVASILFPSDPALVGVAIISLLLLPEMYKIFSIEERQEKMDKKANLKELWKDDNDVIRIYLFLFLGILLTYALATIFLPQMQVNTFFQKQLEIRESTGKAVFSQGLFSDLLSNNFLVLAAIFLIALFAGDGAVLLITWNASVWGTIFGITAKKAALVAGYHPLVYFGLVMLIVLPHVILESLAYICAAISGGIISKDVLLERFESKRFWKVLKFNSYLLLIALLFLLLGAVVETLVLDNVTLYQKIIWQSLI